MKKIIYQIEFFSDWHIGSGLSVAGDVDMAVLKGENKLPYIPGKTLKGLLRHAAETISQFQPAIISPSFIENVFGEKTEPGSDKESLNQCFFSSAYLSDDVQKSVGNKSDYLYRKIASTSIDEKTGTAKDQSLRKIEVTIPLVLVAEIADVNDEWVTHFEKIFKMMKRLGGSRHRGFGRCEFSILKQENQTEA
jgi:CRISPR/Cas system CSM-associated protein Csm3 (group 7 of RAMP superfamily)